MKVDIDELKALLSLSTIQGIGSNKLRALIRFFQSPTEVQKASVASLCRVSGVDRKLATNIKGSDNLSFAERQVELAEKQNIKILSYWHDSYPQLLKQIYDPPVLLFIKGDFNEKDALAIAVVGTRQPDNYGQLAAAKIAGELVDKGISVVSGLAYGIDTIAHQTAVARGGRTIAALGSGLDVIYPASNIKLAEKIEQTGVLLSEFPMGTGPDRGNFPRRNRIISGLSLGVVVVQAKNKSGALITAKMALEQNREVFAVPGSIYNEQSVGTNQLIKEGATLVASVDDIIAEIHALQVFGSENVVNIPDLQLEGDEAVIMKALSYQPVHVDRVVKITRLSTPSVLSHLLSLELANLVKQLPGKMFVRV